MHSASHESRDATTSLRGRVAWTAALATVAGGLVVAIVTALLGGALVRDQEDRRLRGVIETLRFELIHEAPHGLAANPAGDAAVGRIADDEQAEVLETGVRVAAFHGESRVGGSALARAVANGCGVSPSRAARQCVQAVPLAPGFEVTLVAESSIAPITRVERWWAAAAGAALIGLAFAAAWASRRVASRAIAPLEALRVAIASVDPAHPDPSTVARPIAYREVEEIRREFHDLLERVAASLAQSERFAANVAHEWRTPLAALRAEVDLLCEEHTAAQIRDPLRRVEGHVRELSERLDRVLVLARPDAAAGRLAERGEPVSLETTLREFVASLDPALRARVDVRIEGDEEGLVRGDTTLLQMMIRNAVENALVHGGDGRVSVTLERRDDDVVTIVSDQGPGIAEADRERVFEPFYRGARARAEHARGMGLGLALIRHIARLHGGDARFESAQAGASLAMRVPSFASTAT
jgi:signal transduction histidine kinase